MEANGMIINKKYVYLGIESIFSIVLQNEERKELQSQKEAFRKQIKETVLK
jgi:hypothetical protein